MRSPAKTNHAAATATLALNAARAAAKAAADAAKMAQEQCVAVARLEEKHDSSDRRFDDYVKDWKAHSIKIDDTLDKITNHKHDEYISGNKFWGGVGLAVVTGLASIGVSVGLKK